MTFHIHDILSLFNLPGTAADDGITITNVSIDSRSLQNDRHTLFFAIKGPRNDGHDYIKELAGQGVQVFVADHIPEGLEQLPVNILLVPDTLTALQQFAACYRGFFHFPVIGITGSNGKTIVKEWLNFLLSPDFNIIRSPKSYNSQVGVPLSVIASNEMHNLGIFEAGISTVGEMEKLEPVIRPTIGIFTNAGPAHDEGFHGLAEKIREKMLLFEHAEVLIYRKNERVDPLLPSGLQILDWSFEDGTATIFISRHIHNGKTVLGVNGFEAEIPFTDDASVENAGHCLALMLYLKYDGATISARLSQLYPVEMRLKVKNGINGTTLIDDSYSSDFQSLKIALDFLESQKHHKKKTVILSDIFQSGLNLEVLYERVAQLLSANKINRVIGIGPVVAGFTERFAHAALYPDTDSFLEQFNPDDFSNETILIKGARPFGFEKIVSLLEEKTHETVLEINLNAISHNLNYFRSKLQQGTKLMVMVKAFGYGNGGFEIAKLLEFHKADYLGVAFADEGIALKTAGIQLPIMVMNPETTSFPAIIQHKLEPEIYSMKGLRAFLNLARASGVTQFPIHIKIDTGMHRLGFVEGDLAELIHTLRNTDAVKVKSIMSHMATSDDLQHEEFALGQIALFEKLSRQLMSELQVTPIRHILNTSGISNFPEAQMDMVRLGIGLYGVSNDHSEQKYLEHVGTLKSVISQIHSIPAGDSVGYGRRFRATENMRIATIPVGYADGIARAWGNGNGYITIKKQKAYITGSICMDMLMADVSHIDCREGDPVIVFGESPTVVEMAGKLNTIAYEIMTGISQRVKRVFYRE